MITDFDGFRTTVLKLIALRRERLDALPLPDPTLQAELEDLEAEYLALVDKTTDADKAEIGEFYCEAVTLTLTPRAGPSVPRRPAPSRR